MTRRVFDGFAGPGGGTDSAPDQPDTAPDEGAVEALARVLSPVVGRQVSYCYDAARAVLAALPALGYGPTGASGGAGEVRIGRDDLANLTEIAEAETGPGWPSVAAARATLGAS